MHRRDAISALGAATLGLSAASAQPPAAPKTDPPAPTEPPKPALTAFDKYLCTFHVIKRKPTEGFDAHHFCSQLNDDVIQCVIFNAPAKGAKLIGIEYIISDRLYRLLPASEKKFYHPHTYEVASGLLIAPGMKPDDELKLMGSLYTTWGKTIQTWPDPRTDLPMGDPILMWSPSKDGQVAPEILAKRDVAYRVNTMDLRKARQGIGPIPQIDPPRTEAEIGRQYTNSGPDVPPK
jgi:hypothetical protein